MICAGIGAACVVLSRLSLDEPKRQRFSRATSKFSASIVVCLNLISPCSCSIRSRIACIAWAGGGVSCAASEICVSEICVLQASSMAGSIPRARVRARQDIRQ